jgi:hypothetical protein
MPFPRSSLDIIIIPRQKEYIPSVIDEKIFLQDAQKQRWIKNLSAGALAEEFILGGFKSFRIERHEYPILFANHQGGYRVNCPSCQNHLARTFSSAVTRYRRERHLFSLLCEACSSTFQLDQLLFSPTAGFARYAIIFQDVGGIDLSQSGIAEISTLMKDFHMILKRMG